MLWNALLGIIFIGAIRYGDYVTKECPQGSYTCPKYCDLDHKYLPIAECKNGKDKKSRSSKATSQAIEQFHEKAMGVPESKGI